LFVTSQRSRPTRYWYSCGEYVRTLSLLVMLAPCVKGHKRCSLSVCLSVCLFGWYWHLTNERKVVKSPPKLAVTFPTAPTTWADRRTDRIAIAVAESKDTR